MTTVVMATLVMATLVMNTMAMTPLVIPCPWMARFPCPTPAGD